MPTDALALTLLVLASELLLLGLFFWRRIMALSAEVQALTAQVQALQTADQNLAAAANAAVAAIGTPGLSAEDKAAIPSATSGLTAVVTDLSSIAQKLAAATPPPVPHPTS